MTSVEKWRDKAEEISWSIFSVGMLCSFLIIGYQGFQWLKTGQSPDVSLLSASIWLNIDLSFINGIKWQGVQKILLWLFQLPLSIVFMASGAVFGFLFYTATESLTSPNEKSS